MDIPDYFLGDNSWADRFLFYKNILKKGNKMKKVTVLFLLVALCLNVLGCVPLIVGGAAGALGAYAVTKDTIQGESDKSYGALWNAANMVCRIRGTIKDEDSVKGYIELETESGHVWIRLIRLTRATTRIRISARKYHLPNLDLAQDMFVKIMEEAK
jgi:hypothetical protein